MNGIIGKVKHATIQLAISQKRAISGLEFIKLGHIELGGQLTLKERRMSAQGNALCKLSTQISSPEGATPFLT